ncbi:MAG: hypothetical protein ACP5RF_02435 [Candidatus Micrarchaeia archaeon]
MPEKTVNRIVQDFSFSEGNVKGKLVIEDNKGIIAVDGLCNISNDQLKQVIKESVEEASKQVSCCYIIEAKEILQKLASGINDNEHYTSLKFEISFQGFKYKDTLYAIKELLPIFVKEFVSQVNKIENEDSQQKLEQEQTPGGKSIEEEKKEEEEKYLEEHQYQEQSQGFW